MMKLVYNIYIFYLKNLLETGKRILKYGRLLHQKP